MTSELLNGEMKRIDRSSANANRVGLRLVERRSELDQLDHVVAEFLHLGRPTRSSGTTTVAGTPRTEDA